MDAFAEGQMGRDEPTVTSPSPPSRRAVRRSKEYNGPQIELSPDADAYAVAYPIDQQQVSGLLPANGAQDLNNVEVPVLSMEDSNLIAARWARKQSAFMPVGDPYAEPDTSVPYTKRVVREYCTTQQLLRGIKRLLIYLFPCLTWLPQMNKAKLKADVIAGLTVGVMLIPQSMSYADIAGLQYKYGMYTSVLPVITYALMGSSRQLGVGPVAMVSLLVEVGLNGALTEEECPAYYAQANQTDPETGLLLARDDWYQQYDLCPDEYAKLAFLTSFFVGVIQLAAGIARLGFVVSFLAHPVISGFTSAAAIIIGLSQMQYFFGFKIPKSQYVHETVIHICLNLWRTQLPQLALGLAWWFMLFAARRLAAHPKTKKRFGFLRPTAPLITCGLAILLAANVPMFNGCGFVACNASVTNKLIVGYIPSLFDPDSSYGSFDKLQFGALPRIISTALSCSIIGYMESIAIAKSLAAKHKYEVDAGQELVSLGVANLLGSFTSSYPVTGSFSRSAVNNQVGAQTQLSGLITGCLLLLTLLFLTPVFEFLPKYALAAIVVASVTNLVDYKEAFHLWHVKKQDFALWVIAFLGTLFLGVQIGLILAVGTSLVLVVLESVRPQMSLLWRLPGTPIYRNIKQESAGAFVNGVIILRIGSSMYFANVAFIRDFITKMLAEFSEAADTSSAPATHEMVRAVDRAASGGQLIAPEPVRYVVIEMTPVTSIDSTALHMLEDMHRDLKERGVRLAFSTVNNRVEDTLQRSGLIDKMGSQWLHPSVHAAVQHCIRHRMKAVKDEADEEGAVMVNAIAIPAGESADKSAPSSAPDQNGNGHI